MSKLLSSQDVVRCAGTLNVPVAALRAVIAVESAGVGFCDRERPRILFEGHIFHRLTDGAFDAARPDLSYARWTKRHYRGGRGEYERLRGAIELDADAALLSCSWGLGQVMGFNHGVCGFGHVDGFVDAMAESEGRQLDAMAGFLEAGGLDEPLRAQDWSAFARAYNGPGYKANAYDEALARAFTRARETEREGGRPPFVEDRALVAALQTALNAVADVELVVDGLWGPKTRAALLSFQAIEDLPQSGEIDMASLRRLDLPAD